MIWTPARSRRLFRGKGESYRLCRKGKRMKEKLKEIVKISRDGWPMIAFMAVYFLCFLLLESRTGVRYTEIHAEIDDRIPFVEAFVIPYILWFPYIAFTVVYLFFADREAYDRTATMLYLGMTVFLAVSLVFPNILYLRPYVMPRDNVFTRIVAGLYRTDTSTNVFPSIHVYNTVVLLGGLFRSRGRLAEKLWFRFAALLLSVLIILSTVFLKQHSVVDVCGAFAMYIPFRLLIVDMGVCFRSRANALAGRG